MIRKQVQPYTTTAAGQDKPARMSAEKLVDFLEGKSREAKTRGDEVLAETHQQHAEHFIKLQKIQYS